MTPPRITIVTPSYNQGQYLEETLCSVLDQNYPNLEYLVIDGGSTDNSPAIIRKYERHLAWWISEKDRGQAHALNKGFARATGTIHAYLNSDDLYEPQALHLVADRFQQGAPWVVGPVRNFGDGRPETLTIYPQRWAADKWFWLHANPIHQPGSFWSEPLFRRFGSFRETLRFVFDYDLFLRFRFHGNVEPLPVDHPLAAFRIHEESKTVAQGHLFEAEFATVRAEFLRSLNPADRHAARQRLAWLKADYLQARALQNSSAGRAGAAWADLWHSLHTCPGFLLDRRTAGCLKRLVLKPGEAVAKPPEDHDPLAPRPSTTRE